VPVFETTYRLVKSFERRIRRRIKGSDPNALPRDFDPAFQAIHDACRPFTMTGPLRMFAMYQAVKHVVSANVPGDIVECGVWRGGSAMVAAMTLLKLNQTDRTIWLYDTYEGMTLPSEKDVDADGRSALMRWNTEWATTSKEGGAGSDWCYASIDEVRANVLSTGFPESNLRFVKGKVEETIPKEAAERIALLRLDTDWYDSTYHELVHLFPRLSSPGGILILDDYGSWKGAREATDKYFAEQNRSMLFNRIDGAARISVKTN
jgi:O-methyltransferase